MAVTTRGRVPRLADVPPVHEAGLPGYDVATWAGAFVPAGTPPAVVGRIEAAIREALAMPEIRTKLEAVSTDVRAGTDDEMRALLAADMANWGALVRDKGIEVAR